MVSDAPAVLPWVLSWAEPFAANEFLRLALASGILAALACGIVGTWMVLRGLAFIGDALAHGVLPGVAAAILIGVPGLAGAGAGALAMIGGITLVQRRTRLSADTAIGLLFVGMLALGVVMVSRSSSFSGDLIKILFGEILGAAPADLALQASALAGVLLLAWVLRRPFLLLCFSPEHARVSGYDPRVFHLLMLALIGGTVIVSFQTVGTMLVFGLLVAPAAAASLLVHRMGAQMAVAGLLGSLSVTAGLLLSYWGRFAAGATIVLVAVGLFFAILVLQGAWAALARFGRGREDGPGASAMGLAAALAAGGSGSPALQPPAPPRSPATVPALAFRGLDIGHDGQTLVRQLCLELPAGRTLVLTGGNGAGKTTLLRTIAGLIEPTAGSVSVFGRPAREASQQLAWLGQFHPANPLLPLRVRDVVRLARFPGRGLFRALGPADERAVDEALEFVGMAGLGKRTLGRLSGGQRQKVFLAYVLARQARLVLLDEPVQNLDQAGATLVGEAIRRWQAEGATIVMATHDPHEAGRADLVMNLPAAMVYTVSQEASQ